MLDNKQIAKSLFFVFSKFRHILVPLLAGRPKLSSSVIYLEKFGYQNGIHYICKKDVIMTVVSIRDFRANQSKYLGLAAGGESVILTSRAGSFKIVPITEDDSLISKKEFFARIDEARKSIAEGKGTSVSGKEALDSLLSSL